MVERHTSYVVSYKLSTQINFDFNDVLTYNQLKRRGCVLITVLTDVMVLKQQATTIHNIDLFIVIKANGILKKK